MKVSKMRWGLWPVKPYIFILYDSCAWHGFHDKDKDINPVRIYLGTPMIFVSLTHKWAYVFTLVIIVEFTGYMAG